MPETWTFESIEDEKELPPGASDALDNHLAKWLVRIHLL